MFVRTMNVAQFGSDYYNNTGGVNSKIDNALVGDHDPQLFYKTEKPVHRTMVNMAGVGYTTREIAEFTGYDIKTVSNVLRQPWARERLITEAKKTVQDEMKEFLESEVLPSLHTLKEVRDDVEARRSDRITASNSLLDRFLGKPVQPISENQKPPSELSDEELRKQVEAELRQAAKQ
jgi:hypothetical protein